MNFSRKKISSLLLSLVILFSHAGCSVGIVLAKPNKKNISKIKEGMSETDVAAFLGVNPMETHKIETGTIKVYEITKGVGGWAKFGRSLMHLGLDFCTLCIWEVAATPGELLSNKEKAMVKVLYDNNMRVQNVRGI